jgi:hypothetical protein
MSDTILFIMITALPRISVAYDDDARSAGTDCVRPGGVAIVAAAAAA